MKHIVLVSILLVHTDSYTLNALLICITLSYWYTYIAACTLNYYRMMHTQYHTGLTCYSMMHTQCHTGLTYVEPPSLILVTPTTSQRLSGPLAEFEHPGLSGLLCCAEAPLQ